MADKDERDSKDLTQAQIGLALATVPGRFPIALPERTELHPIGRTLGAVDVIPHGVDRKGFHPFAQLKQASFASPARAEEPKRPNARHGCRAGSELQGRLLGTR